MEKSTPKPTAKEGTFDIAEIQELLKAFTKSNVNELKLEKGEFKITIRQGVNNNAPLTMMAAPTQMVNAAPLANAPLPATAAVPSAPAAPVLEASNTVIIKSPMIGTFYRASAPGKPVFVNVGDIIEKGKVLCMVEAMKLFNEIESEISGKIVKVLIDDASPVEYDQPLFLVEPA